MMRKKRRRHERVIFNRLTLRLDGVASGGPVFVAHRQPGGHKSAGPREPAPLCCTQTSGVITMKTLIVGPLAIRRENIRVNRHNNRLYAWRKMAAESRVSCMERQAPGAVVTEGRLVMSAPYLSCAPKTFMNKSGDSLAAAMRFYKLEARRRNCPARRAGPRPRKVKFKTGADMGP